MPLSRFISGLSDKQEHLQLNIDNGKIVRFGGAHSIEPHSFGNKINITYTEHDEVSGIKTRKLIEYQFGVLPQQEGAARAGIISTTELLKLKTLPFGAISKGTYFPVTRAYRYDYRASPTAIPAEQISFADGNANTRAIIVRSPEHSLFEQVAKITDAQMAMAVDENLAVRDAEVDVDTGGLVGAYCGNNYGYGGCPGDYLSINRLDIPGVEPHVLADYIAKKIALFCHVTGAQPEAINIQAGFKQAGGETGRVPTHREPGGYGVDHQRMEAWTSLSRCGHKDGLLGILPGVNTAGCVDRSDPQIRLIDQTAVVFYKGMAANKHGMPNQDTPDALIYVDNNLINEDRMPAGGLRIRLTANVSRSAATAVCGPH